jgi:alanine-synthesizing transaminase
LRYHPGVSDKPIAPAERVRNVRYAVRDVVVLADQLRREGKRMLALNIGDPNPFGFRPPAHLLEATFAAMQSNRNGYAPSDGIDEAVEAIEKDAKARGIGPIVYTWVGSGCSEVIDMALSALVNPGENVLTPSPGYPLYTALLAKLGAENRAYQLDEEAGWQPDVADIERLIDANTRAIVVINPNNPTGSVASESTLRGIVELAIAHNLVIFADEIYDRLLFDGAKHVPLGSLDPRACVLSLCGLSKNWVLPGWRIGWGALSGPEEQLRGYITAIQQLGRARLSANHPEQYAIKPALEGPQDNLTRMIPQLVERRDAAMTKLREIPDISCVIPQGAFYAFPRIHRDIDDAAWCRELMRETGVITVPGSGFGQKTGTSHFRIVLLPDVATLEEACAGISRFMQSH